MSEPTAVSPEPNKNAWNTKVVTVVERTETPRTWFEDFLETAKGALKGALISGGLSAIVGAVIGAVSGIYSAGDYINQLDTTDAIKVGGGIPVLGGPAVMIPDGETIRNALTTNATATSMGLSAANSALNVGTSAALVGAGVGAIKSGWVDKITRERVLAQQCSTEPTKLI